MAVFSDTSDNGKMLDFGELRRTYERLRLELILIELDLAITFCDIADTSVSAMKAKRNANYARRAFGAAVQLLAQTTPSMELQNVIDSKFDTLRNKLQRLNSASISTPPHDFALSIQLIKYLIVHNVLVITGRSDVRYRLAVWCSRFWGLLPSLSAN